MYNEKSRTVQHQATNSSESALQHPYRLEKEKCTEGTRLQRAKLCLLELPGIQEVNLGPSHIGAAEIWDAYCACDVLPN